MSSPVSASIATIRSLAVWTVAPASSSYRARPCSEVIQSGVSRSSRPSRVMTVRLGRSSSRHQVTSVRSPNVQHIAMPAPRSISAAGCASTGTSTSNSGERTVVPKSAR